MVGRTDAPRRTAERLCGDVFAPELHDQSSFAFSEQRIDRADDAGPAGDHEPVADLKRPLAVEVAGRDHLLAATQLVTVRELAHRPGSGPDRTATRDPQGVVSRRRLCTCTEVPLDSVIGLARSTGCEPIAGVVGVDQAADVSAAADREWRENVFTAVAEHLWSGFGLVVSCVFGELPDHQACEFRSGSLGGVFALRRRISQPLYSPRV